MKLLTRYLAKELARSYLVVALGLLVLFNLISFLNEAEDIGDGNYTTANALAYVLLTSPARLIDLTPFVCLLAALVALSQLNRTNELTAVRSTGVSSTQIALTTLLIAVAYVVPIAAGDGFARQWHEDATLARMHATSASGNLLPGRGFWTVRHDTYVNVAAFDDSQNPTGIRIFEFDSAGNLNRYLDAKRADASAPDLWRLYFVTEKRPTPAARMSTRTTGQYDWKPIWDPNIDMYDLPNTSLSLRKLSARISYLRDADQVATGLQLEFWKRCMLPVTGLILTLFAAPFALRPNPRGGMSGQIALGSLMALLIYLADQVLTNTAVLGGMPPPLAVALPGLGVLAVAVLLLRRTA